MSDVGITPLGNRILVEETQDLESIKGGIVIPDCAKEKPQEVKVVALGTGTDAGEPLRFHVSVGDLVLISKYGGTDISHDDKLYRIVCQSDILAIVG